MGKNKLIKIGDTVTVVWINGIDMEGVVLAKSSVKRDYWVIETSVAIHYVKNFETIFKEKKEQS